MTESEKYTYKPEGNHITGGKREREREGGGITRVLDLPVLKYLIPSPYGISILSLMGFFKGISSAVSALQPIGLLTCKAMVMTKNHPVELVLC